MNKKAITILAGALLLGTAGAVYAVNASQQASQAVEYEALFSEVLALPRSETTPFCPLRSPVCGIPSAVFLQQNGNITK